VFLFFNNRPDVKPGSEIFVPKKLDKPRTSLAEILGIGGALASLAAIVLGFANLLK